MTNERELIDALRKGTVDVEWAVAQFSKSPFETLGGLNPADLLVDTMDCGFPTLNDYDVFKRNIGELIVVVARPGMGKSAFIFQIAQYVAKTQPVLVFSLEMSRNAIVQRMVAQDSGMGLAKVKRGQVPKERVQASLDRIAALSYNIHHDKGLDIDTFASLAREGVKLHAPGVIVVDYLQIMRSEGRNRAEEVAAVAEKMSKLAAELKTPILTASQASRACEARGYDTGDFVPGLSDLAESSKIEHYADTVLALSREEVYTGKRPGECDLHIIKNRSGQTGQFSFKWLGSSVKFLDPALLGEVCI